ncbi:hypothetical protein MNEG_7981 [Monoraphidium neglectum]|uniref:Uncharacterized protein n=1 Tax=Monoraphidium neglectum TaxID=145388 RepID=A0A0D2M9I8_9CHLO|nr:hypothetical protein MNEG_7981 [Monoraphidium neglectum]KIY99979.1 hypothetical protein MNEG_7981 [Monoraphidium neglectum]|eukprot:XP_013898999.1 hypothetical protein MNEG_7981 [Monoraphidium neglectum]
MLVLGKISALPPFEPRRTLEGLLDPRELWSTLKAAAFAARGWLGTNPWKALTGAYTSGTLTKLDVRAWSKILAANLEPVADVYPGRWRRSALSPIQWFTFMLNPPDEATIRLMFAEGQADGEADMPA